VDEPGFALRPGDTVRSFHLLVLGVVGRHRGCCVPIDGVPAPSTPNPSDNVKFPRDRRRSLVLVVPCRHRLVPTDDTSLEQTPAWDARHPNFVGSKAPLRPAVSVPATSAPN